MKKEKLYYQIRIDYFWLSILAVIIVISMIIAYYASAHEQTSSQPVSTKHRADIDSETHGKLKSLAEFEGRSINGEVLYLIRQAIAQHEKNHGTLNK